MTNVRFFDIPHGVAGLWTWLHFSSCLCSNRMNICSDTCAFTVVVKLIFQEGLLKSGNVISCQDHNDGEPWYKTKWRNCSQVTRHLGSQTWPPSSNSDWIYSVLILNLLSQNATALPSPMTGDSVLSSILIINS